MDVANEVNDEILRMSSLSIQNSALREVWKLRTNNNAYSCRQREYTNENGSNFHQTRVQSP